jgi:hypothetical protein
MAMKKNILALLLIFNTVFVFGQTTVTCTLPDIIDATPGTVTVPVNITAFDNIAALSIYFEYDPTILTYSSYTNPNATTTFPGLEVNSFVVGNSYRIGIVWSASGATGATLPSGVLANIVFNYVTGTGNFTFLQSICEVTNMSYATVPVLYTDGSIAPSNPAFVSIPELTNQAAPNNGLLVPVNVDFQTIVGGVNSFTFVVAYDETKLTYQNFQSASLSGIEVLQLTNPTRIVIEWSDAVSAGSLLNGKLLDLVFNYIGGTSALSFDENLCHIGDHNALEVPAVYTDGLVTQNPGTVVNVTAATKIATPGTVVLIPVTANNFTNIGAFDFLINYDLSVLSFTGLVDYHANLVPLTGSLATNITATGVGINWQASATALTIPSSEKLFDMQFTYNAGSTTLKFDPVLSAVSTFGLTTLTVEYVDGAVSETQAPTASAVMPDVVAIPLTTVDVPINATGFAGIGAFDLVVAYDVTALEFKGIFNPLASLSSTGELTYNATGGKVYISWAIDPAAVTGLTIADNEKLFDIEYAFNAGSSVLAFDQTSCVVSKFDLDPVIVSYTDGSVEGGIQLNLKLFLEGLYNPATGLMNKAQDYVGGVTEDKFTGTIADQITVELHNTANYTTTVHTEATVNLNTDGTASVTIPSTFSGSYYVTIKQRNHIETVSASPVSFASFTVPYDFTTAANKAYGSNMKLVKTGVWGLFAGDIDQDANININDGGPINTGIKVGTQGYLAIDINGDGVVNINDVGPVNISIKSGIAVSKP